MTRILLGLVFGGALFAVGVVVGAWWNARPKSAATPSDREIDFHERMAVLQHHTDLLERSRKASLDGEPGLANIYSEAAERVMRMSTEPPAPD